MSGVNKKESETWKLQFESVQWKLQENTVQLNRVQLSKICNIEYNFADAKLKWLRVWYCSPTLTRYCTVNIAYYK